MDQLACNSYSPLAIVFDLPVHVCVYSLCMNLTVVVNIQNSSLVHKGNVKSVTWLVLWCISGTRLRSYYNCTN